MSLVKTAKEFATKAHAGQFRRDGKTAYITHPEKVAALLNDHDEKVRAAAWLHDVIEDCGVSAERLEQAGFPSDVVFAVRLLTRANGNDYALYIEQINSSPIARAVKVADMLANLTDAPTKKQIEKYTKAILLLVTMRP